MPYVEVSPGVEYAAAQTLTAAQATQARQNIFAAPFDALAYNGMQINGSMDVSQERGTSGTNTVSTYALDGWIFAKIGTVAPFCAQALTGGPPGLKSRLFITISTAQASMAAGDLVYVTHPIEGYRIARLAWGTVNAQPLTIGFWCAHVRAGTYSGTIKNGAANRSYAFTYTQDVPGIWEYKTVTIPGDATGTWATDNTAGLYLTFAMACGTTFTAPSANAWVAGNYVAAPGQINGVAATSDAFNITGVVVLPGIEAPSAARSPLIMRPYDQELLTCQRYFRSYGGNALNEVVANGQCYSATGAQCFIDFVHPLRAAPTFNIPGSWALTNAATAAVPITGIGANVFTRQSAHMTFTVAGGLVAGDATKLFTNSDTNARLTFDARL